MLSRMGHDADVSVGQDADTLLKVPAEPVQEGDRDGVPGPDHLHQVLQPERARE